MVIKTSEWHSLPLQTGQQCPSSNTGLAHGAGLHSSVVHIMLSEIQIQDVHSSGFQLSPWTYDPRHCRLLPLSGNESRNFEWTILYYINNWIQPNCTNQN